MSEPVRPEPDPSGATPERLPARTVAEATYYLLATACPHCGKGPLRPLRQEADDADGETTRIVARCGHCAAEEEYLFACPPDAGATHDPVVREIINPSDEPSRLVDVAQWIGLFHRLIAQASAAEDTAETRRLGYRAALCLTEALKFYAGDEELPPDSAFFSPAGLEAFREHPDKFTRRRLRDMRDRLPSLSTMAEGVARDARPRRWWEFWKRR